jgi:transglutaminase-like putative cysteine protease
MLLFVVVCLVAGGGCGSAGPGAAPNGDTESGGGKSVPLKESSARRFRFHYDLTVTGLPPRTAARVWVPVAQTTPEQCVEIDDIRVPAAHRITTESRFGNRLLYFEAESDDAGRIPVRVEYRVERFEITPDSSAAVEEQSERFLDRSALALTQGEVVPRLFPEEPPTGSNLDRGRSVFEAVDARMTYDKTLSGWGRGDVAWACTAGAGNCSDFHSVFIAACQDLEIPARFEIGFPIPAGLGEGPVEGYHCWARFAHEGRWLAADISEADKHPEQRDAYFASLPADRVQFTVGRDLILEPRQQGEPVNFLVYPHVEIDGPAAVEFEKRFRFEEIGESVCAEQRK